jgi:intein-encoded DNA endonuclease-like protein
VRKEELAYIAGFLDGDGCIMLQLVFRHDYVFGYQIRASIVFYQKQSNASFLNWLKEKLKYGYIRNRNDGMCEYTIVGVEAVSEVVKLLKPFLVLKRKQADLAIKVLAQMPGKGKRILLKV